LKEIQFHERFQLHQCSKLGSGGNATFMAATLGAGVQDGEMFAALAKHNATAVGGTNMVRRLSSPSLKDLWSTERGRKRLSVEAKC
jgi:hypothetical protein